jgi:ATPase subunit of ABC transporter with duplicated ATPase domains
MIEKLNIEEIKPSSRRYPAIIFEQDRDAGDQILNIENLSYVQEGETLFSKINVNLGKADKVVVYSKDSRAVTAFYEILNGEKDAASGKFQWGVTTGQAYLPLDHDSYFDDGELNLVDWLRQFALTEEEREEVYIRGFLGKMIFSGEEAFKKSDVLSGGEKVRCMLSKMMMSRSNVLLMYEPTNHLDLESITALNNALTNFKGTLLFTTHDHAFAQTVGTRIIELTPKGVIDRFMTFDEYMTDSKLKEMRLKMYA